MRSNIKDILVVIASKERTCEILDQLQAKAPLPTCEAMMNIQKKKMAPMSQNEKAAYQLEPARQDGKFPLILKTPKSTW